MHDFQIVCTCRSFQPRYTGNLNFVKGALAGAARLDAGKLDVVLNNCSQLHLELNFHTLGRRPIDLRIENSGSVRVVQVVPSHFDASTVGREELKRMLNKNSQIQKKKPGWKNFSLN